jgi:hypothetical protein
VILFEGALIMKRKPSYLWVIPAALLFPVLQLLIFLLRFRNIPDEMLRESWVFAPVGLISVMVLICFLRKEEEKAKKSRIIKAFILAVPFALIFSLTGGLINTSPIFIGIYGSIPLIIGILIGRRRKNNS